MLCIRYNVKCILAFPVKRPISQSTGSKRLAHAGAAYAAYAAACVLGAPRKRCGAVEVARASMAQATRRGRAS
jgi:hypothetical protein